MEEALLVADGEGRRLLIVEGAEPVLSRPRRTSLTLREITLTKEMRWRSSSRNWGVKLISEASPEAKHLI
jgi:hypothetical protein